MKRLFKKLEEKSKMDNYQESMDKTLIYNTRNGDGNDIIKKVVIKPHCVYFSKTEIECPLCHKKSEHFCKVKELVSASFTDWALLPEEYVCADCADLFSLYFYSYISSPNGIKLLNVRELKQELTTPQPTPFLFVISTSQKKHLFYRSKWNYDNRNFYVNLETETIMTTPQRMKLLFDVVECLQTLGASKEMLKNGIIPQKCVDISPKLAFELLDFLKNELRQSREIQIPLFCGQKRNIEEEEAICYLTSTLKTRAEQEQR